MNKISKMLTGVTAAALMTTGMAAPASAQYSDPYRKNGGISTSDIITGVAILGGIAAVASAIGRGNNGVYNNGRYPSTYGYGTGYGEQAAVDACSYEAQRRGGGGYNNSYGNARAQITDVRRSSNSYRVRGVIDAGYNNNDVYNRGVYNRGYNQRVGFTCKARDDGRITSFKLNNDYNY